MELCRRAATAPCLGAVGGPVDLAPHQLQPDAPLRVLRTGRIEITSSAFEEPHTRQPLVAQQLGLGPLDRERA
jgi:hypothetical protein